MVVYYGLSIIGNVGVAVAVAVVKLEFRVVSSHGSYDL